jgi:hypothetical protein
MLTLSGNPKCSHRRHDYNSVVASHKLIRADIQSYTANIKSRFPAVKLKFSLIVWLYNVFVAHVMFFLAEDTTRSLFKTLFNNWSEWNSLWLSTTELLICVSFPFYDESNEPFELGR